MLRLFRGRALCIVTALVLAVGTTTAAFDKILHAGTSSHDVACALPGFDAAHDGSSHRFTASADTSNGEGHCVACHIARAPRLSAQGVSVAGRGDESDMDRPILSIGSARPPALAGLPARSPPRLS